MISRKGFPMIYCSNSGAAVSANAKACPNCHGSFGGTGQGTAAGRLERQKSHQQHVKASQRRDRNRAKAYRREERLRGSSRKWRRVAGRSAEAMATLEAFCATIQQGMHSHPSVDGVHRTIDFWAHDVIWLRTPPNAHNPKSVPGFTPGWKQFVVGPHSMKYPTRKAIRYIENGMIRTECNLLLRERHLDHDARALKDRLYKQLRWVWSGGRA